MVSPPQRTKGRIRWQGLAGPAGITVVVVVLLVAIAPSLTFVEVRTLDFLFGTLSRNDPDPRVVLIDVGDDPTAYERFRQEGDDPPEVREVPRRAYAQAARLLSGWGADAIAFDLWFSRKCGPGSTEDEDLAAAFAEAGNVVVAATAKTKPGAVGLKPPISPIREAIWGVGSPGAHSPNEVVRSVYLIVPDYDTGQPYMALSLAAYQCFMGAEPGEVPQPEGTALTTAGGAVPLRSSERLDLRPWVEAGHRQTKPEDLSPVVEVVSGSGVADPTTWDLMLINWAGPAGTFEPLILADVLEMGDEEGRERFEGKAVIIGRLEWDEHWTGVGKMAGPELQANALHTLVTRSFVTEMGRWGFLGLLTLFAATTVLAVRRFKGARTPRQAFLPIVGAGLVLMLCAGFLARRFLLNYGTWMYLFILEADIVAAWGITIAVESGKVAELLARFVPAFLARPEDRGAGQVQTLDASLLFSDIRDFTTTAEHLAPAKMLGLLNAYHSTVEDFITKYGGTIVKTPGDAVLAVFWQEQDGLSHAACALRAGRELLADIPNVAGAWEERGVRLNVGVGINAGEVAIGFVGKHHLEPTVIGDPVNVSQRLESLTKELGYSLIFSEAVRERLGDQETEAVYLDRMTLKGRQAPVTLYGLCGPDEPDVATQPGVDHSPREGNDES